MSWPTFQLQELTEPERPITYGVVKPGPEDDQGVLFVRGGDISDGKIAIQQLRTITSETSKPYARTVLRGGELLISLVGNPGEVAIAPPELAGANIARQVGLIALRPEFNSKFIMYFLRSPKGRAELFQKTQGAVQQVINLSDLKTVKVALPDLPTQQRIAGILSAYDDLIENNRRRIGLLEQAARLIYREWFVHLRFPGHETAKIVDCLPEGWERATLSDHVELVKDAVQPGAFRPDDVHIGLEHIPRRSFVLSDWEPTEGLESHKFRFAAGDIIFGKIRPYFHKVGFALRDGVASSDAFVWRVKKQKAWSLLICATSSDHFVAVASKTVKEGSKMPRADWKVLAKYKIPKPNDDLLAEFDGRVRPIAEECRKLALQNRALTRARDLLLPRLMDGRIPV